MRPTLLAFPALAALASCGGNSDFSVITYNAGLATGFVPAAEERTQPVADALAATEADIICLQEVWYEDHIQTVKDTTADTFPHSFFPAPNQLQLDEPACQDGELDSLLSCMEDNCTDICADDIPGCLLSNCPIQFLGLGKDCNRCTQANVGATPSEIAAVCETETIEYSYGGSFGTGLLSKHPIVSTKELLLESTTSRRSVLHAVVDLPGGEADVYCTHLTAIFSLIPYPREEGSWAEEQRVQVETMVDFIDSSSTHDTVVVMGDMNNGPAVGNSEAEYPEHYALLEGMGMSNPYVEAEGECTFCNTNNLTSTDSDEANRVIDHVFVKGHTTATPSRVYDQAMDTESCGEAIPGHLSDHYGVRVDIER